MTSSEPQIAVGILNAPEITFSLHGKFQGSNGRTYEGTFAIGHFQSKVKFQHSEYAELIFTPTSDECFFELQDVVIGINFHWERKENQSFKGALKLIPAGTGQDMSVTAINLVKVEEYLTSVISSEMSATASDELLKAHAVISRSWLLNPIVETMCTSSHKQPICTDDQVETMCTSSLQQNERKIIKWYERDAHTHFDVCADDHCQRYQGITRASTAAVTKAIEATRGEVLMYDGQICDARFSKSCGGASETFENCWAPEHYPYLTRVIDNDSSPEGFDTDLTEEANAKKWIRESPAAFCNTTDKQVLSQVLNNYDQETTDFYRWKVTYTQDEIAELLQRRSGIDFGSIIDLIPQKRGESGRIIELKIVGSLRTVIVGKELEIRKWLSNSHLYSSAFVVDKADGINGIPQQFTLTGAGWGHGVGLCQIGAAVMGEKGYTYDEILLHYFNGAELKRIY